MVDDKKNLDGIGKKPKKRRLGFQMVILLVMAVLIALFAWSEKERRETKQRLSKTETELQEVKKNSQLSGEEVTKRVLEEVKKVIKLPEDPAPSVATIVDVENLKKANPFFNQAKNGDHLIITSERAILYDPERKLVIDVVPVVKESPSPSPVSSPTTNPKEQN